MFLMCRKVCHPVCLDHQPIMKSEHVSSWNCCISTIKRYCVSRCVNLGCWKLLLASLCTLIFVPITVHDTWKRNTHASDRANGNIQLSQPSHLMVSLSHCYPPDRDWFIFFSVRSEYFLPWEAKIPSDVASRTPNQLLVWMYFTRG